MAKKATPSKTVKNLTVKKNTRVRKPKEITTIVGIVRDHSGSMGGITHNALKDFNSQLAQIQANTDATNNNLISVVECGINRVGVITDRWSQQRSQVNPREVLVPALQVQPINRYPATGGTPLWDSVGELINQFKAVKLKKTDSVLIVVITDGEEAHSHIWDTHTLRKEIERLQDTGQWTFAFRVPQGYARRLQNTLGIPADNITEWEQTARGFEAATQVATQSYDTYFKGRAAGQTMSRSFFVKPDLNAVNTKSLKATLIDIKSEVNFWTARQDEVVKPYCERMSGQPFVKGAAFYQLIKKEKAVQSYKLIAIRDKVTGSVYAGDAARDMLGLPHGVTFKLEPGDHGKYDIYIQSTSVNRKLPQGSNILYWPNVAAIRQAA